MSGDKRGVRFTACAATGWRYTFGGMIADLLPILATEAGREQLIRGFAMPLDVIADQCAAEWEFYRYLRRESLRLREAIWA